LRHAFVYNLPASRSLLLALGLACGWALLAASGALEALERLTVQARYAVRPAPGYQAPVTVVAIDERSLARYGQMPWDRHLFARLLDRLHAAGAAVVGIDVAFNEPSRDASADQALAASLARVPTVLPTFLAYADAGHLALRSIEPLAPFAGAAAALGSVQLSSHPQTQIWEVEPYQAALGRWVPAFPVAVCGAFRGAAWSPTRLGFPWREGPRLIDFRGPAHSAPQVSALEVLEDGVPAGALKGRMVLVGAVATGLPDTNFAVPDPRSGPMSGVELAANVIDNLISDGFLRRLDPFAVALLLLALAAGPGRLMVDGGTAAPRRAVLAVGTATFWLALAFAAFWHGVWLELTPVLGLLATCHVAGMVAERTALLESRNELLGRYTLDLATEAQRQRERIEGELHDGVQQLLIVMSREIKRMRRTGTLGEGAERLQALAEQVEEAQQEVKRLRGDLLPPALRHGGLLEALPVLANERRQRGGLDVKVEVASWEPLSQSREIELYWLVHESLNNAEKHAGASNVRIKLEHSRDVASIEVIDDGRGFVPPDLGLAPPGLEHSGLHRMWLRMRGNQGNFQIFSAPGQGTRLRFALPSDARRNQL
jgi:CHASE2 domain-containing sensor protein/anti-sigma regulatory factor (Ser/Thr protein kinase)